MQIFLIVLTLLLFGLTMFSLGATGYKKRITNLLYEEIESQMEEIKMEALSDKSSNRKKLQSSFDMMLNLGTTKAVGIITSFDVKKINREINPLKEGIMGPFMRAADAVDEENKNKTVDENEIKS